MGNSDIIRAIFISYLTHSTSLLHLTHLLQNIILVHCVHKIGILHSQLFEKKLFYPL